MRFQSRYILFLLPVLLSGCMGGSVDGASKEYIAKVNNRVITIAAYQDSLKRLLPQGYSNISKDELLALKKDLLNQMIEEELILQEAERLNISVSEAEVSSEVSLMKEEYGDESFKDAILQRYDNIEKWKEEIKRKLLVRKVVEKVINSKIVVSEEEALRHYEENLKGFDIPEQVRVRMIVVATEEEAKKVKKRLKAERFEEVAKEVSLSPEGEKGGDLGFFSPGDMPPEFEEVVFRLRPGEVSPVVKTQYGFHIFLVVEKRKARTLSFDEVRGRIIDKISYDKSELEFGRWLFSLRNTTEIKVKEELL